MLYSSHQIHINQLSCVNFNVGSNFKIHVPHTHNFGCWVKICVNGGMRVNFKTYSPPPPLGLTQNPFWLPYWINMMRLSPAQILFLYLQLVCSWTKRAITNNFRPRSSCSPFSGDCRTILFLQLLTGAQVTGKSHPTRTILSAQVIPLRQFTTRVFLSQQ